MSSLPSQNPDEPSGLLKILGAFFSGVLFGLFFSKLRAPIEQPIRTDRTQDNAEDERRGGQNIPDQPVRVVVERLPPSNPPTHEQQAEKKRDRRPQWWIFIVNIFTLAAVIVYACITAKLWHTAEKQIELGERAWVGIDTKAVVNQIGPDFNVQYVVKNVGHSAALIVIIGEPIQKGSDWRTRQRELCDERYEQAKRVGSRWGRDAWTVIPEFPMRYDYRYRIPNGGVEALPLENVGCILYRSAIEEDTVVHRTYFDTTIDKTPQNTIEAYTVMAGSAN
jgi:hypothetical protein